MPKTDKPNILIIWGRHRLVQCQHEQQRHRTSDMTDPISEFYTRHPYPPPVANLDRARDEWRDANRHRANSTCCGPARRTVRRSTSSSPGAERGRPPNTRSAGQMPA